MSDRPVIPLVAVDVGNSRIKLGWFGEADDPSSAALPEPVATLDLNPQQPDWSELAAWIEQSGAGPLDLVVGSVNRSAWLNLAEWFDASGVCRRQRMLTYADLPLRIDVAAPDKVGIDRLLGAVAANRLRRPDSPTVVVDLGSAITVDWITADGAFAGGAILPGIAMSARALHDQTDVLPHLAKRILENPPDPLGKSTTAAIESGLFWGAIGGVLEVVRRLREAQGAEPTVFLTGGAAPVVAGDIGPDAPDVPHQILGGTAITAEQQGFWPCTTDVAFAKKSKRT